MKSVAKYDEKNRLYFPVTLIDSDGRFNINDTSYALNLNNLKEFTAFSRPVLYVEQSHPADIPDKSEDARLKRYITIDTQHVAGTLELNILRPNPNRVVVVGHYFPVNVSQEIIQAYAEGRIALGVRARVTQNEVVDIITWDLVSVPERILQQRECKRPPLNTTVFVSSNRGYTWFPAQFLWIGENTFVWRNMLAGAKAKNENTNNNRYTYFQWAPVPDGLELITYNGPDVPESLLNWEKNNAD